MDPPRLMARGDLLAALDRAAAQKVTIISAPAGCGKTSLLRVWEQSAEPTRVMIVNSSGQHLSQSVHDHEIAL
jgi:LuxR family maltose regulon positive regulatory protein